MSSIGQIALRKEHLRLVENVDPRYIADYLYANDCLSPESLEYVTDESKTCRDRCRHLLLTLCKQRYALAPLLNALIHDNNFPHLCTELLVTLGEVIAGTYTRPRPPHPHRPEGEADFTLIGLCNPSREIKRTIFTKEHFLATQFYCKFRRLLNQGNKVLHEFDNEVYKYQQLWDQNKDDSLRRHFVANRYFEIKILQMRKLSECGASDVTIRALFSDIAQLVPYTSHPSASITSLLTIYAHAHLTARKPCEEVLDILNEAKSNFIFLPGCRETSLVLITEFKVYWQIYEKGSERVTKEEILQKAAAAAMHFASDDELDADPVYKLYLNRGLQFLQTLANLGLGYTLRNIRHDRVLPCHVAAAQAFLKTVDTGEGWQHLELRWRVSFYVVNAKICYVQGDVTKALELANNALELSGSVHFKEEHENVKEFVQFMLVNGKTDPEQQTANVGENENVTMASVGSSTSQYAKTDNVTSVGANKGTESSECIMTSDCGNSEIQIVTSEHNTSTTTSIPPCGQSLHVCPPKTVNNHDIVNSVKQINPDHLPGTTAEWSDTSDTQHLQHTHMSDSNSTSPRWYSSTMMYAIGFLIVVVVVLPFLQSRLERWMQGDVK